ncbi:1996_t:CDS:2 [Funneliformis geosporum]|uniref:1996_t:CDS:1 n=1 Tax=Funneliformis geosporum TaxID=1117311 RepID=A0A9W4SWQ8_9GLOM|nr:1996_t:CDS:2 [Funneliformis geosporum]
MDQSSGRNSEQDYMEIVESSVSPVKTHSSYDDMEIVDNSQKDPNAQVIPMNEDQILCLRKKYIKLLINNGASLNCGYLKEFISCLNPLFEFPNEETLRHLCNNLFEKAIDDLKKIFEEIDNICLTCNFWICKGHGIIALTANWISNTYKPQEAFLTLEVIDFPFTSLSIKEKIKEILYEWNISNKVSFITTENVACMIEAIKLLGEEFNVERIPCVSHTLQFVIAKAMNINQNMQIFILRVKRLVYFFNSPKQLESLIKAQEALHYTSVYKKVKEIPTRWNSAFYSWEKLLILRKALTYLCNENNSVLELEERNALKRIMLDDDEWVLMDNLANREILPLFWWENNEKKFPYLSKVAKEYLAISVTSTNSTESSFDKLANIITFRHFPPKKFYFLKYNTNSLNIL